MKAVGNQKLSESTRKRATKPHSEEVTLRKSRLIWITPSLPYGLPQGNHTITTTESYILSLAVVLRMVLHSSDAYPTVDWEMITPDRLNHFLPSAQAKTQHPKGLPSYLMK